MIFTTEQKYKQITVFGSVISIEDGKIYKINGFHVTKERYIKRMGDMINDYYNFHGECTKIEKINATQ